MINILLNTSAVIISISIFVGLYRVVKGPSMPDRVIALDMIGINLISLVAVVSLILETTAFLEVVLLLGILAFIGTVAFAKFIEKGVVIERKRD
ncbi:multicomponent Na+:H+ antiporter subunit F [Salibacterium salarium]|uniref:Na(+)/H(+) antiporter subunit F1 n=1 Tax=Salibacterium salarium TaxID=284579 RepID=A0A428N7S1_9BACI|nr:Na(+)/H(+) antiporter subunit F1 [Salibacterium salarium]MDQ0299792.1 multicomponent Na+:H+ antiporter subunit F [Salibacterium salarium]RSL34443.1 Na(+)/H(+) antiporter subunit F1 [Salibacterium salarium]